MSPAFKILARDPASQARCGHLETPHGGLESPVFMPVGTQASVKAVTPAQLREVGAQIILGNTYHLNIRPGSGLIRRLGGLHAFMAWERPILTDSGGYQVFSLSPLRRIEEEGIHFRSHLNGDPLFLGPREVISIQKDLGSDIAMPLDECPPYPCEKTACAQAVQRTVHWAARCREIAHEKDFAGSGQQLFAIVQGGRWEDLRQTCAESLLALDFPGYAVGGVSVGEPEEELLGQTAFTLPLLPQDRPRYVMGVGTPPQLLQMIAWGADMFDCVIPTREARHGTAFTPTGKLRLRNHCFSEDSRPLSDELDNYTCRHFSRAYLRHLLLAGEILAPVLLSLHNLHFYLDLMRQAREHIRRGDYTPWHKQWISRYESGSPA